MTSIKRKAQEGKSKELAEPPRSSSNFEDIPGIPAVAPDSRSPRVKDKVVIVTGANSPLGIGRAAAHLFAQQAPRALYLLDYEDEHLSTHVRELRSLYSSVPIESQQLDATDESAVEAICKHALDTYGRLDVMFANAGIGSATRFQDLDAEDFMRVVKGNLLTAFLCAKHAAVAMQKRSPQHGKMYPQGSIIMTASAAGLKSNAGASDYSAAKAGVISLARTLSYQLAGTGVRVNALCPGIIETGMTKIMYEAARQRGTQNKIGQLNPLQRGGVSDEVARVALFLASDESSYVNGQALAVDGGLSAGLPFVPGKLA
ncbi:MAG: hypothetical protein Q9159_001552 [Coniocarpon cinnabarinum]